MARRSTKRTEPAPPKEWTLAEVERGITKLRRRMSDVESLGSESIAHDDPRVGPLESEIVATIEDVFGTESREHREHRYVSISYSGPTQRAAFNESAYVIQQRSQAYFQEGVKETLQMLQGLIRRLEEIKEDFRKCPKCNFTYRNLDYCTQDGTPLVSLSFDPEATTLQN